MTRLLTTLMALCACVGFLNAEETYHSRTISIRPFTGTLVAPQEEESARTVKFQKGSYWIRPNYQVFLDGAPPLKVCFGFKGTRMDAYLNDEGKEVRIVSTSWHTEQYDGFIASEEYLASFGINGDELQKALSFLSTIHYSLSKNTWKRVQPNAVTKGETALLLDPPAIVEEEQTPETQDEVPLLSPEEQVLILADQTEQAHTQDVADEEPPTAEQEAQAVAEFIESLPEELQHVVIDSPVDNE